MAALNTTREYTANGITRTIDTAASKDGIKAVVTFVKRSPVASILDVLSDLATSQTYSQEWSWDEVDGQDIESVVNAWADQQFIDAMPAVLA